MTEKPCVDRLRALRGNYSQQAVQKKSRSNIEDWTEKPQQQIKGQVSNNPPGFSSRSPGVIHHPVDGEHFSVRV